MKRNILKTLLTLTTAAAMVLGGTAGVMAEEAVEAAAEAAEEAADAAENAAEDVKEAAADAAEDAQAGIEDVKSAAQSAVEKAKAAIEGARAAAEGKADEAKKAAEGAADEAQEAVEGAADEVKEAVEGAAEAAGEAVEGTAEAAAEAVDEIKENVEAAEEEALDDEENYDTGDASLDDIRNQDEIGENEMLVVSFGTSFNDSRRLTIGAIEGALAEAFPDWSVRRAFTAQIIIDHIEKRDGLHIDNVTEALERAVANGVKKLVVVPTHLMAGLEYDELEETLAEYADAMDIYLGVNLLNTDEDFAAVEQILVDALAEYDDGETALIYMGHGTEAESNAVYAKMQSLFTADGHDNYYVGTVEAEPSLDDILGLIADKGYTKAVLRPMMVVAGDHANNDMASLDDPESWYSVLTDAGYDVTCVLEGLGQIPEIQQLYVAHTQEAVDVALADAE